VGLHPASELIESFRATLQKLEQDSASLDDQTDIAELKSILLNRIADLELVDALNGQSSVSTPDEPLEARLIDLPPVQTASAEEPAQETASQLDSPPSAAA